MGYKNHLDPHSELFHHNWSRPKRVSTQVNGETKISQHHIIAKTNCKAHRFM